MKKLTNLYKPYMLLSIKKKLMLILAVLTCFNMSITAATIEPLWECEAHGVSDVVRSSIGFGDKIYVSNVITGCVEEWHKGNKTKEWNVNQFLSSQNENTTLWTAITCDDFGNILVNIGGKEDVAGGTKWLLIPADGSQMQIVEINYPSKVTPGRIDYIGRVIGNLLDDAYAVFAPSENPNNIFDLFGPNQSNNVVLINLRKDTNGQVVSDLNKSRIIPSKTACSIGINVVMNTTYREISSLSSVKDVGSKIYLRNYKNSNLFMWNGNHLAEQKGIGNDGCTARGFDVFTIKDVDYYVVPCKSSDGRTASFEVRYLNTGDVAAQYSTNGTEDSEYSSYTARVSSDGKSAVIYAFNYKDKIGVYTFKPDGYVELIQDLSIDSDTTLKVGETAVLNAMITPSNATNKMLSWVSMDESIATVDNNGMISAIAPGNTKIIATTTDGTELSDTCAVTVIQLVQDLKIDTDTTLNVGETAVLNTMITPENATNKTLIWTSNNIAVATVINGTVTALSAGTATITATTTDGTGLSAACTVTVKYPTIYVQSISIEEEKTLNVGETTTITATISPSNASNKSLNWTSLNTDVATVSNGVVTAKSIGTATITATTTDGTNLSDTCVVTVNQPIIEQLWVHDMSSVGSAVRNIACVSGSEVAATNISFSGGADNVIFFNASGQTSKYYDVAKFLNENKIGTTNDSIGFSPYGLGRGIDVDGVGNIVVNLGFPSATSATNFVAIAPDGTMKHIVCEVPVSGEAARADFLGVAGDIFTNGYIGLTPSGMNYAFVYNIYEGEQDKDYSYLVNSDEVTFSSDTKLFFSNKAVAEDTESAPKFYVYYRATSGVRYSDGHNDMVVMEGENFLQGKATNSGATAFVVNGITYIVMPTLDESGARANAFKIVNVATGEVALTCQGAEGFATNYAQDFSSYVNEDGTVSIAQLVQGKYLAMYVFDPSGNYEPEPTVAVESLTIDNEKTLNVGETATITATILPDNASNKSLNWTSLNTDVATVSNGVVIAKSAGTATITATTTDGTNLSDTCVVTVEKLDNVSSAIPNVFASALKSTQTAEGKYQIDFTLNTDAEDVTVKVYSHDENAIILVKEVSYGAKAKGANSVELDLTSVNGTGLTWAVEATGPSTATDSPVNFVNYTDKTVQYGAPTDVKVDNDTESEFFGRVYVLNAIGKGTDNRTTTDGLYVLDAALTDVAGQGDKAYAGNIVWAENSALTSMASPHRMALDEEGNIFVCDWSDGHSGVWYVAANNLNSEWKPVFGGTRNGGGLASEGGVAIHGSLSAIEVAGKGEERTLYTYDEDYIIDGTHSVLNSYKIGTLDNPWVSAPTTTRVNGTDGINHNAGQNGYLQADGKGGLWVSQYRGGAASTHPALVHYNAAGVPDFTHTIWDGRLNYAFAVNQAGDKFAVNSGPSILLGDITYDENDVPTVTLNEIEVEAEGTKPYGLAFDAADNLYRVASDVQYLQGFAWPKENNSHETKAPSKYILNGKIFVESLTIDSEKTLNVGETATITATILPDNATNKVLEWYSSNDSIATVSNGIVTAHRAGYVTITATTTDGSNLSTSCAVTVEADEPEINIALSIPTDTVMSVGNVVNLIPLKTITIPTNSTASEWSGDVNGYGTVINDWVLGYEKYNSISDCVAPKEDHIRVYRWARFYIEPSVKTAGDVPTIVKAVLTCTGDDYAQAPTPETGTVTAANGIVTWEGLAEFLSLAADSSQLRIKTIEMTATPSVNTMTLQWYSTDESVAVVNNGTVTAIAPGTTQIIVTDGSSLSDTCIITVEDVVTFKREMRSSWIVTSYNIDWPTISGTSSYVVETQKSELVSYLDHLEAMNMTSSCFQVRSMGDAMYPSLYAPWSSYISGTRGTDPGWDPLAFFVEECHKRGLEAYVHLNPYRWSSSDTNSWSTDKDLEWKNNNMFIAGTSNPENIIFNPALSETRQLIVNVVKEILNNYNIDGILFDDYFYPSGGTSEGSDAPDYSQYIASGTAMSIGDWRRKNINDMVADCYNAIQELRPDVRFGISPAGVSSESASKYGLSSPTSYGVTASDWQYSQIYLDPLSWMNEGIIDFIAPQLLWSTTHTTAPYEPLTHWWCDVAEKFGRHYYTSHFVSDINNDSQSAWEELCKQVSLNRGYANDKACGSIYYTVKYLTGGTIDYLKNNIYFRPALSPQITWKSGDTYGKVSNLTYSNGTLSWDTIENGNSIIRYTVYAIPTSITIDNAMAADGDGIDVRYLQKVVYDSTYTVDSEKQSNYWYAVCVFDGYGKEHEIAVVNYPEIVESGTIGGSTAVETIKINDSEEVIEYYNLQGMRVENPEKGIYIKKQGSKATKVILK